MRVHGIFGSERRQRGFTLTEALVSFGVAATGLLTIVSFQADLFTNSAYNKARTEALSLAQQKIEQFRHYTMADEDAFIDDDGDGAMDADGTYSEDAVTGQNAVFTRSWVLDTTDQGMQIEVSVSWVDAANIGQVVNLAALVPWISPRSGVDQLVELSSPSLSSPAGRAVLGEGVLSDYPDATLVVSPGDDGMTVYQNSENLLLVTGDDRVVLTLLDACNLDDSSCTDFVKIAGTVYMDTANTNQAVEDTYLIASDAAYCQRWVPSGSLTNPPTTAAGDYEYFNYACYLGGGWHGNVGLLTAPGGIQQTDKVCQGDPVSDNAWEEPVIALRRSYRGMLQYTMDGETVYRSHGIKDAAQLSGHDFVFTALATGQTEGSYCEGSDAPMTRADSSSGSLFAGVPTDFFCLNTDADSDSAPDYLDTYDTSAYSADTSCPYDPTDPPVTSHTVSGSIFVYSEGVPDFSKFDVVTSDGPGNCRWTSEFTAVTNGYTGMYQCNVYDWGSGWTGYVQARPNSTGLYCLDDRVGFEDVQFNQTQAFTCVDVNVVIIEGLLSLANGTSISGISIVDTSTAFEGSCNVDVDSYACSLPYGGLSANVTMTVLSNKVVCDSVDGVFAYSALTAEDSPYTQDIYVESNANKCL